MAVQQREKGLLNPGDPDYDTKMTATWGGPPIKWFNQAMDTWPEVHKESATKGKIALVTGGTGGIGLYVTKLLAKMGATVIVPGRPGLDPDTAGMETAVRRDVPGCDLIVPDVPLDLRSTGSITEFGAAIRAKFPRIDILCLNAGRGGGTEDPKEFTVDGTEAIIQVNALGHFQLTNELLPLLKASKECRIISQTSGARLLRYDALWQAKLKDISANNPANKFDAFDQYCLSKCGNVLFTRGLNKRLEAAGIRSIVAAVSDPGLSSTGVNMQHDLAKSVGMSQSGSRKAGPASKGDTADMHTKTGHHAADGALAMSFGCVCPIQELRIYRCTWCTTDGPCDTMEKAAHLQDPTARRTKRVDPIIEENFPDEAVEIFWEQACKITGASWRDLNTGNRLLLNASGARL